MALVGGGEQDAQLKRLKGGNEIPDVSDDINFHLPEKVRGKLPLGKALNL